MERKIGEIFEYNGEWYQCMEDSLDSCVNCCFYNGGHKKCSDKMGECFKGRRSDNNGVYFKKLEKVGEPFSDEHFELIQKYELKLYGYSTKDKRVCFSDGYNVFIKTKQNQENMEENYKREDTPLTRLVGRYVNNLIDYETFEEAVKELYSDREESKPVLKEFDLEAAKAGKPVCTRDGRKARIICFDYKGDANAYPILALISTSNLSGVPSEIIAKYTEDGRYAKYNNVENDEDLMMLPEKKEGWVNIYEFTKGERLIANIFLTREEAMKSIDADKVKSYITTIKIEWEE